MTYEEVRVTLWIDTFKTAHQAGLMARCAAIEANEAVAEFGKAFPTPKDFHDRTPPKTD